MQHHPIHWLYRQFTQAATIPTGDARCYLCGASCAEQYSVNKTIADTFNSHFLARCPSSSWLCAACAWYFDRTAHPIFVRMSLVVQQDTWMNWQREHMKADILHMLQCGVDGDAYVVVSLNKKKHLLLQAPLNASGSRTLAIQVEEQVAHLTLPQWEEMDTPFMRLLSLGHGKGEILSGHLHASTLRKHGQIAEALQCSSALEVWRNSPHLELLSYVTIVDKESEDEHDESRDGRDGTNTTTNGGHTEHPPTRVRNTPGRSRVAASGVERHRQGVSEQVSHDDLDTVRGARGRRQSDHEQLSLFLE